MVNYKEIENYKPKILCFTSFYYPGFKGGGPIRTITNFVEYFWSKYDIYIVCLDRDLLDTQPYKSVKIDSWNKIGKANIFYASKKTINLKGIYKLLNERSYNALYLNSFFSFWFSIVPFLLNFFCFSLPKPCIIAPRGEFSNEALKLKNYKKKLYINFFYFLNLHLKLFWQASSEFEKKDIIRQFGRDTKKIFIAPDLVFSKLKIKNEFRKRSKGPLRMVFLSRISPMKNLDFLLRVLRQVKISVQLFIYGPKDDTVYWRKCIYLKNLLPSNIKVIIEDEVPQNKVQKILKDYDLLILPTRGENFGHIIIESLIAGVPVLISNRTLWKSDRGGAIECLPLIQKIWMKAIIKWGKLDDKKLNSKRKAAFKFAQKYLQNQSILKKNEYFFNFILKKSKVDNTYEI
tara:strand:+ start:758 stop:1966 length:1209 start_codon:yes stop_codon:yes gene_type:complete